MKNLLCVHPKTTPSGKTRCRTLWNFFGNTTDARYTQFIFHSSFILSVFHCLWIVCYIIFSVFHCCLWIMCNRLQYFLKFFPVYQVLFWNILYYVLLESTECGFVSNARFALSSRAFVETFSEMWMRWGTHECRHSHFVRELRDKVETLSFPSTRNWFANIFPRA